MLQKPEICFLVGGQDDHAKKIEELPTTTIQNTRIYIHIKLKLAEKNISEQTLTTSSRVPCRKLRPSDALFVAGAVGVALRCRRSDAAEVEPWSLGGSMWGVSDV